MTEPVRGSSRAGRLLLVAFLVAAMGTFLWGFWVVGGVRQKARDTDAALRARAWRTLCYHSAAGEWPKSDDSLRTLGEGWLCAAVAAAHEGSPATLEGAMAGLVPPDSLDSALRLARIGYAPQGTGVPRIDARGNPSGIGTLGEVNGWLAAAGGATDHPPTRTGETNPP